LGGEPKTSPHNAGYIWPSTPLQQTNAPLVSIYADEVSLGKFPKMKEAVAAVSANAIGGAV
jgi:hypothetical protein